MEASKTSKMEQFGNRIEYIEGVLNESNEMIAKKADQVKELV